MNSKGVLHQGTLIIEVAGPPYGSGHGYKGANLTDALAIGECHWLGFVTIMTEIR